MEYFIGSLATVVFFVLVGGAYYLGTKQRKTNKKAEPMSEEQKRTAAQLRREYNEIMSYDVDKARGGTS